MCLCGLCTHECRDLLRPEVSDSLHLGSWSYRWMGTADRFWELSLAPLHEQCDYSEPLSHPYYLFCKRLNLFLIVYTPHQVLWHRHTSVHTHAQCAHMQYTYMRHTWTRTHQHVHKCTHNAHIHDHAHTCAYTFTHIHTHSHTYTCTHIQMHEYAYTFTNRHTHTHTNTHTHSDYPHAPPSLISLPLLSAPFSVHYSFLSHI